MRTITPPSINAARVLRDISTAKRGPRRARMLTLAPRLRASYLEYVARLSELALLSLGTWSDEEAGDCNHCYDATTAPLDRLDGRLKAAARPQTGGVCPYCGINAHDLLDHYAPRKIFPQFSVFPLNLVPACSKCNTDKGVIWLDETGERRIVSVYHDLVPADCQYIFASVAMRANGVPRLRYRVSPPRTLAPALRKRIRSHYASLDLCHRFTEVVDTTVSEARTSLMSSRVTERTTARLCLSGMHRQKSEVYGLNHWQTVAVQALLASDPFLDAVIADVRAIVP